MCKELLDYAPSDKKISLSLGALARSSFERNQARSAMFFFGEEISSYSIQHDHNLFITVNTQIIGGFLFGNFGVCQMFAKLNVHQHKYTP